METTTILDSLKSRRKELNAELSQVERAILALDPGQKEKPAARKPRATKTDPPPPELTDAQVMNCIPTGEPLSAERVAVEVEQGFHIKVDTAAVKDILNRLSLAGELTREGKRGAYTYTKGMGKSPFPVGNGATTGA